METSAESDSQTGQDTRDETEEQKQQETSDKYGDPSQEERPNKQGAVVKENGLPISLDNNDGDNTSASSEESSDNVRNKIPRVNCPEKIMICLDLSPETNSVSFQSRCAPRRSIFQLVQKAMSIFVKTKSSMNPDHEFGILVLEDTASWLQHFTHNVETICSALEQLAPVESETLQDSFVAICFLIGQGKFCDILGQSRAEAKPKPLSHKQAKMESLLTAVHDSIEIPVLEDLTYPPPCVLRLMVVYGRSLCQPGLSDAAKQVLCSLLQSPYFFFDVLYVHELPSESNHCEATYDMFCNLDEDEVGYMLEVSRSTTRLFDHMAALLAHPLQRPKQRDTLYKLTLDEEEETNL